MPSGEERPSGRKSGLFPPALFACTLFLSAVLLFAVQPMIAKAVLPRLGGAPAVWTTCALFFQAALLLGYAGAHAAATWLGFRSQIVAYFGVLIAAAWLLPIDLAFHGSWAPDPESDPTGTLLVWLARTAGLPFVAVAATAPLLQRWFSITGHSSARDPYFLYAASNTGSLAALIAYPLWIERDLPLGRQSTAWTGLFLLLPLLAAACASATAMLTPALAKPAPSSATTRPRTAAVLEWIVLSAIPSSLMLGVTAYLTTDLAALPLLWVVPLGLYLVSFILVFGRFAESAVRGANRLLPWLVMFQAPVMVAGFVQPWLIPLHLATFFSAAVVCHGELARRRPEASRLTGYYLAISFGGVLGGLFNALAAPTIFDRLAEYPIAIVAACLILGLEKHKSLREAFRTTEVVAPIVVGVLAAALFANLANLAETGFGVLATMVVAGLSTLVAVTHRRRPVRFALTVGALLAASGLAAGVNGRVLERSRNFFGVLTVTEDPAKRVRRLFHGSTLHGQQSLDPLERLEPSTYFHRTGPVGALFFAFDARPGSDRSRVGVTGLGVGTLASYARAGQRWTFFEIDPAVVRVANDPALFTFLRDCRAGVPNLVVGDARLGLAREADNGFNLLILDAFSSDSIPVHLLTREALALYRRKLAPGGLIAVNLSNRYLDLSPVVARLAADAKLSCRVRFDPRTRSEGEKTGARGSIWAVLAAHGEELGPLDRDPRWFIPKVVPGDSVWTDDHSDLLSHLWLRRARTAR